ncbi:MAG: phage late control D family protein, partial [Tannerella sp.]|nr:phage late control D family protein [Tannerella sp.]
MSKLNTVETKLRVAGEACHFRYLHLTQKFNAHHAFEIHVDYEELDSKWMGDPVKLIKLIGQRISIAMKMSETGEENLFAGYITNVSMTGHHGEQNYYVISGCGDTILLDGKAGMNSFTDRPLEQTVKEAVETVLGNGALIKANPAFTGNIYYLCQYNETCFEFLNRLSWMYGEFFYSDGFNIYFGNPHFQDETTLIYDIHLTSFHLSARAVPAKVNRYEYLVQDDTELNEPSPDSVPWSRGYIKVAKDRSDWL